MHPEDCNTESGFRSAANANHIAPAVSVGNASINLNRGGTMRTPDDKAIAAYHDYVEGMEESLVDAKQYTSNINSTAKYQTITELRDELAVQRKQTDAALEQITKMMKSSIPVGGVTLENPTKRGNNIFPN